MSIDPLRAAWKRVDQNASQNNDPLHGASSTGQKTIYPSLFPMPGASCPPLVAPPSSWASAASTAGGVPYAPNYPGRNVTQPSTGRVAPMKNAALTTNKVNLPQASYVSSYASLGNVLGTAPLASEPVGHCAQSVPTSSYLPLPAQPTTVPAQAQVQSTWSYSRPVQGNATVAGPSQQPTNTHSQNRQAAFQAHAPPVSQDECLSNDQSNGHSQALVVNPIAHPCIGKPGSLCLGQGPICLDILLSFVSEHSNVLTAEDIGNIILQGFSSSSARPAGPSLGVSATVPTVPQSSQVGPIPSSSTTSSTQGSTHSSPTGACPCPSSGSAAASSSSSSTVLSSRAAGKRKRSESDVDGDGDNQQQEGSQSSDQTPSGSDENQRKKRRGPADEIHICRICEMLGVTMVLSRRDSLKRHIAKLHAMFVVLFGPGDFDLLKPRRKGQVEDLRPWIQVCVSVQMEAKRAGAEIKREDDLTRIYSDVATLVSNPR